MAIRAARAAARWWVWDTVGTPRQDGLVILDLDATLVIAHPDKEWVAKSWKTTFGFHPLLGSLPSRAAVAGLFGG